MGDLGPNNLDSGDSQTSNGWFPATSRRPGREVQSPLAAGKLLQLWSIREQSPQSLTFIKPPSPSSVTVRWGCLAGHSLIKSGCPKRPWRHRGALRAQGGREGEDQEAGGGEQMLRERPFVLLPWQLMLGSDILRGSGDSIGDIPVCDSMTNLCLHLILESVETAQRTAVWACWAPVCWRHCSLPLCKPRQPGTRAKVREGQGWEIKVIKLCCRVRVSSSIASLTPLCGMMNWSKNEFSNILQGISCSSKKKQSKFWILSRRTSFKEPIFSNTS